MPHVMHVAAEPTPDIAAFLAPALRELSRAGVRQTLLHGGTGAHRLAPLPPDVRCIDLELGAGTGAFAFAGTLRAALRVEAAARRYGAIHLHGRVACVAGRLALRGLSGLPPVYGSHHGEDARRRLRSSPAALAAALFGRDDHTPVRLHPPVDEHLFELPREPQAPALVAALGTACRTQGADRFAELAARFHFAGHPARFTWIGDGEPRSVQQLRAAGVDVTGELDAGGVEARLVAASALVHTARREAPAWPLAQAMAAGLPVLALDTPPVRELVAGGVNGLVEADLGALALALKTLLDDEPGRAQRLGAAARREARRRFAGERFGGTLMALYRLSEAAAAPPPSAVFDPAAP